MKQRDFWRMRGGLLTFNAGQSLNGLVNEGELAIWATPLASAFLVFSSGLFSVILGALLTKKCLKSDRYPQYSIA